MTADRCPTCRAKRRHCVCDDAVLCHRPSPSSNRVCRREAHDDGWCSDGTMAWPYHGDDRREVPAGVLPEAWTA